MSDTPFYTVTLSDIAFRYETQLAAFFDGSSDAARAFNDEPTSITSSGVIWGNSTDGVILDSSINYTASIDQLLDAIENGLETEQFRSFSIYDSGNKIFELAGSATDWSITSDDMIINLSGDLPTNMSDFVEFAENLSKIPDFIGYQENWNYDWQLGGWNIDRTTLYDLPVTERNEVIYELRPYNIDRLTIRKDQEVDIWLLSGSGEPDQHLGKFTPNLELDYSYILADDLEIAAEIQYITLGRKDFGDLINTSGISLLFEDELSAFSDGSSAAAKSLTYEPTSITSNGVVWGTSSNGVILDSAINYSSSIEVLSNAINDGLETGQFRSLSIRDAGNTIFELSGSATEWSVKSGDVGFVISGNLPTSMSGLLDFVGYMSKIPDFLGIESGSVWDEQTQQWIYTKTTPLDLSISERNDVIDGLRPYDIDRFEILPGDDFSAILTSEAGTNLDIRTFFPESAFDFSYIDLAQSLEILAETQYIELGQKDLGDLISFSDISFRYENELSEFFEGTSPAAIAFGYQPTSITSNGVIWGSSTNGVFLDTSITNISTLDELTSSIENGLETGQFRSLSVYDDGQTIFELSGSATEWSIASDDTSLKISGDLPTSMSGLLDFLGNLSKIPDFLGIESGSVWDEQTQQWIYTKTTPLGLSVSERNDVIDGLRPYDIDRLQILKDESVSVSIVSESGLINKNIGSFTPELELDFSYISLAQSLERLAEIQNDAPVLTTSSTLSTNEGTAIKAIAFSGADIDGDTLTYSFSDPAKGSITNNNNGTYTYTPDANANGSDSFTITVNDGTVDVSQNVGVTINAVNDAPVLTTSSTLSTNEDTASAATAFAATDVDGDTLTYSFGTPSKGSVANNGDGTYTYTPNANVNGSDSFTITASDGSLEDTKTVNVTINAVNDAPLIPTFVTKVNQDQILAGQLPATDVDSDQVYYGVVSAPKHGALNIFEATGAFSYQPDNGFHGNDTFKFFVTDNLNDFNKLKLIQDFEGISNADYSMDVSEDIKIKVYPKTSVQAQEAEIYTTNLTKISIKGISSPHATIQVFEDDNLISESNASADGIWQAEFVSNFGKHNFEVITIHEDDWYGEIVSSEYTALRSSRYQNSLENVKDIYSIVSDSESSFSFLNASLGIASAFDDAKGQNIILNLTNDVELFSVEHFHSSFVAASGDIVLTTQMPLADEDHDYRLDPYIISKDTIDISTISDPAFIIEQFYKPANTITGSEERKSGFDHGFDSIGLGITHDGNPITLLVGATSTISVSNYTGSYENDWNIWSWDNLYLAYPGNNSYKSNGFTVSNNLVQTAHVDAGGKVLGWTEAKGPKDHIGYIANLATNKVLAEIGRNTDETFTFHVSPSSSGLEYSYIETPSWYGNEDKVLTYLSASKLNYFDGSSSYTIAEGSIPYQEISNDGKFVYFISLDQGEAGTFIFDTDLKTTTQISNFDDSEYNTDAKILDQFLSNGFPRSIIASRFFHETDKTFDELIEDFTFLYPQLDADGRVAIGIPSSGTTIGRILDFWDSPQNVPLIIAHRDDLPQLDRTARNDWIFDTKEIYKLKNTASKDSSAPIKILGASNSDVIETSDGDDEVYALGGDDNITTSGGNDLVFAGNGNDTIIGGSGLGNDSYDGGPGIDAVKYTSAEAGIEINLKSNFAKSIEDQDTAKIGYDSLFNIENIIAGNHDDLINGDQYSNSIFGEGGNDTIFGDEGDDSLDGGKGDDTLTAGTGSDSVFGGEGADTILFGSNLEATDRVDGGTGLDHLHFTDNGSEISDLNGVYNVEVITLGNASTNIQAVDTLVSNGETLIVNAANLYGINTLVWDGSSEADGSFEIIGSGQADIIKGGWGDDTLDGGFGADTLFGGNGSDTFKFASTHGLDVIKDFNSTLDKIEYVGSSRMEASWEKSLNNSGHDVIVFEENDANNQLIVESDFAGDSLQFDLQKMATIELIDDHLTTTLSLDNTGKATAHQAEFNSVKITGITDINAQIGSATVNTDPITISDVIAQLRDIVGLDELRGKAHAAADIDNDGEVQITDVIANLRNIVGLDNTDTFDLVTDNGFAINALHADSVGSLSLVINGDADLSHEEFLIA